MNISENNKNYFDMYSRLVFAIFMCNKFIRIRYSKYFRNRWKCFGRCGKYNESTVGTTAIMVDGVLYCNNFQGDLLMRQTDGTNTFDFQYDAGGEMIGFVYNGTPYIVDYSVHDNLNLFTSLRNSGWNKRISDGEEQNLKWGPTPPENQGWDYLNLNGTYYGAFQFYIKF